MRSFINLHAKWLLVSVLLFLSISTNAQLIRNNQGYDKNYHFIHSANLVADKNFYLLTVIDHSPAIKKAINDNVFFKRLLNTRITVLKNHVTDTCTMPLSLMGDFRYTKEDSLKVAENMGLLYKAHRSDFDQLINNHLRPSGYYQRFAALNNMDLLLHAWGQYITGINYIIDQFGLGKKMRYPHIDSANYVVTNRYYRTVMKDIFALLDEHTENMKLFYQPSLEVALQLMQANDRDEPARFEPMEKGENKKAIESIKSIKWEKYSYATIVIPGNGPPLTTTPISPDNKIHCDVAAMRYLKGWAPFIIVSGGYCYPFRGPYCEAIEMKKYLMHKYGIKENAIIIDPHARHTTTNIRNADRLMIRYGIPLNKPSVFVTSKSQHDYSMNHAFDLRNQKELGYLPYRGKKSISNHDIVFYPVYESLHMDPLDPLDP